MRAYVRTYMGVHTYILVCVCMCNAVRNVWAGSKIPFLLSAQTLRTALHGDPAETLQNRRLLGRVSDFEYIAE